LLPVPLRCQAAVAPPGSSTATCGVTMRFRDILDRRGVRRAGETLRCLEPLVVSGRGHVAGPHVGRVALRVHGDLPVAVDGRRRADRRRDVGRRAPADRVGALGCGQGRDEEQAEDHDRGGAEAVRLGPLEDDDEPVVVRGRRRQVDGLLDAPEPDEHSPAGAARGGDEREPAARTVGAGFSEAAPWSRAIT